MKTYEKGKIIKVVVSGIVPYGIFVKIDEKYNGLIHISEISDKFVKTVGSYVTVGEKIYTRILDIDEESEQFKLSIKNIAYKPSRRKRLKIQEAKVGFRTLAYKLPYWIEENLQNTKNKINSIDK